MTHSTSYRAILLVDDDREILEMLAMLVGFETESPVRCFNSPEAAWLAFSLEPQEFQFVITDFDMPGMNGADLLRKMREMRPDLQAVVFSGSSSQEIAESGLPADCPFLAKPMGLPALVDAIHHLAEAA